MSNLKNYGRLFYGLGIMGIGILHFFFKGFRPVIAPVTAEAVANISFIVYLVALYIIASGAFIAIGKQTRNVSLMLGVFFFICLLIGHLPVRLRLGSPWTDAIKIFALSGGAFVIASVSPPSKPNLFFDKLYKIAPAGKYFFAIMLVIFGLGHLTIAQKISALVPKYIPWGLFWTYIAGVVLMSSGLAFIFNFKVKWLGLLLSISLFLWLVLLHMYYAIMFPSFQDGESVIAGFECAAFLGTALIISQLPPRRKATELNKQIT
nr:hypothetical protein [uncultured Mucilaginibacter sp.]